MEFTSRYEFDAKPEAVFDALTDPETVGACLPGCEGLESIGEDRYRATLSIGVGAIKGRFRGTVELHELQRPASYRLRVDGRGAAGFASGEARIRIDGDGPGSTVAVESKAQIGGPVARVGQRLLAGTAKTVADRFFACIRERLRANPAAP